MKKKITLPRLQKIISEEIKIYMNEAVDHEAIREIVNGASKLLAAVESFKETATQSMTNAVTPHIDELEKVLENMVSSPGSYVPKEKPIVKKVSLKPTPRTEV
jgi:predicted nucleic acid-binding protein